MTALMNPLSRPATEMIQADHTAVITLFHKLGPRCSPSMRAALIRRICTALEIHAQLEEEIFYPAVRAARVELPALDKSPAEHEQMRQLIQRVRGREGDADAQLDAVCELMNAVLHHAADEETMVLPTAERVLGQQQLVELATRMNKRKLELARPHAGEMGADLVKAAPGKTALVAAAAVVVGAWWMLSSGHRHHDGEVRYG